jgi:RNA polymerase sigma factor (sigma-70 family)
MPSSNQERNPDRLNWLTEIYRAYAADLQRFIAQKIGDATLAEDLTSIVFLKALRWLREDQRPKSVRGWLYATARTTIIDHWQMQRQSEMRSLSGLEEQLLQSSEPAGASKPAEMRVQHLLSLLPERDRRILTLHYLERYSTAEIAEALGTSPSHIRVLHLRALRRAAQVETRERSRYRMQQQPSLFDSFAKLLAPESRQVLALAREEMLTLSHWWIGTEHMLWGLAREGSLSPLLTPYEITPERIHAGIVFIFDRQGPQGPSISSLLPVADVSSDALTLLTPRAKLVIVLAGEEMKREGEQIIHPKHLLLGLLNEGEGLGAGLLRTLGISLSFVRTALLPPAAFQVCTFCGRGVEEVARLFPAEVGTASRSAPKPDTFICDHCVRRFSSMLGTPSS